MTGSRRQQTPRARLRISSTRRVPRERLARLRRLDRAEAPQLIRLHVDLTTQTHTPRRPSNKVDTVRIQRLVDGRRARLRTRERHTTCCCRCFRTLRCLVPRTEVFDDGRLHRELDPVERDEPDDVPHPDDSNPATRNGVQLREAPISERSNDGGDNLREDERAHERVRGAFHEAEPVRTRDEDKCLRDNCDLEVHDRVQLRVVVIHRRAARV